MGVLDRFHRWIATRHPRGASSGRDSITSGVIATALHRNDPLAETPAGECSCNTRISYIPVGQ